MSDLDIKLSLFREGPGRGDPQLYPVARRSKDNTSIDLLSKWLTEKNPTILLKDNGKNSVAVGSEVPDGHWHWIGYIYTIGSPATHFSIFTYFSGDFDNILIADPLSFEMVHEHLVSGPPQKCKACMERDANANKAI